MTRGADNRSVGTPTPRCFQQFTGPNGQKCQEAPLLKRRLYCLPSERQTSDVSGCSTHDNVKTPADAPRETVPVPEPSALDVDLALSRHAEFAFLRSCSRGFAALGVECPFLIAGYADMAEGATLNVCHHIATDQVASLGPTNAGPVIGCQEPRKKGWTPSSSSKLRAAKAYKGPVGLKEMQALAVMTSRGGRKSRKTSSSPCSKRCLSGAEVLKFTDNFYAGDGLHPT